jgi:betaine-aldehyde dehydrogenase
MPVSNGHHYINGMWVGDAPNGYVDSVNPATGKTVGSAPNGSRGLAEQAIIAAREAFEETSWASDPRLRAKVLLDFADRLEMKQEEIAQLMAQENGKVLGQAMHEVAAGFGEARYYAGVARNVFGRTFESGPGKMSLLTREPSGVVSVIVPWNAPVTLLVRSVAPALAAGCTVVIKPATQTPLTNAAVISCFDAVEALPKGVVNSVNEFGIKVGEVLSTHPQIDVISFTGSTKTGKTIMANAADTIKHVSLELGGKAPAVVFDDADLVKAMAEIRRSSITLNGQMCTVIARVLVHDAVYDEMTTRMKAAFESVRIGNPMDQDVELGPLVDKPTQQRILQIIDRASIECEVILKGGPPGGALAAGAYVTPSIFATDDVTSWMVQDELFGPIISIERFSDEAEALAKANATRFGLAASVYTNDLNRAMRMGRKLKFGTVWLNCHNRLLAEAETGGYRESGIGRLHGIEAINDFLETKHIYYEAND